MLPLKSILYKLKETKPPATEAADVDVVTSSGPSSTVADRAQKPRRKSVHFSDRAGYDLYDFRIVEDPVGARHGLKYFFY
jgi:hypothetical protein